MFPDRRPRRCRGRRLHPRCEDSGRTTRASCRRSNRLIYERAHRRGVDSKEDSRPESAVHSVRGRETLRVSLIIAGVDDKQRARRLPHGPHGAYQGFDAIAIGAGSDQVNEYLEKNYSKETTIDQAVTLAIECIYLVSEDKHGTAHIKTAVIDADTKKMRRLTEQEIGKNAGSAKTRSEQATSKERLKIFFE